MNILEGLSYVADYVYDYGCDSGMTLFSYTSLSRQRSPTACQVLAVFVGYSGLGKASLQRHNGLSKMKTFSLILHPTPKPHCLHPNLRSNFRGSREGLEL